MSHLISRAEDFPGDEYIVSYTLAPTDVAVGGWMNWREPRIVTVSWRISGLTLPFSGSDEGIDMHVRGLVDQLDDTVPPNAPDIGVADRSTSGSTVLQSVPEDLGGGAWLLCQMLVIPRWVYLTLEPWPANTNTATVLVTVTK